MRTDRPGGGEAMTAAIHSATTARDAAPAGAALMARVAVIFDNLGPYHLARLKALDRVCELTAIELHGASSEYDWLPRGKVRFACRTLAGPGKRIDDLARALRRTLTEARPDAVFIPGWSSRPAIQALLWAQAAGVPTILMSDSRAEDAPRRRVSEWLKRRIVAGFSGALVAGTAHRAYARGLGVPDERIRTGYDVVDNAHFAAGAVAARAAADTLHARFDLPARYFLASARLVEKKNLFVLIEAYLRYREQSPGVPLDLVIIGDGELRPQLEAHIRAVGLQQAIRLPGFIQYHDIPTYYGLATALVMPSATDQWGLVVNEAMACGLPVLVSAGCGAARDLVAPGENGYIFDPTDRDALAGLMACLADAPGATIDRMGAASRARIAGYTPESFAAAAIELVELVRARPARRLSPAGRLLLALVGATRGRY